MATDIKKILEEKDRIYSRLLDLLEQKARDGLINDGNINILSDTKLNANYSKNIANSKKSMSLGDAMQNSFNRIAKYSKRNI